ncbi:MAG TPA: ABC transporter permease [Clostridia bacterium]|nr:ABC transporter permease [Clostridia bacterium]
MKRTMFAYPYVVWMVIFILAPVLLIVYYSVSDASGAFTLENIRAALFSSSYMKVLLRSILVALEATAVCLLLGYPIAYLLSKMKKSTASLLSVLFVVPMWMNFLLRTYALQLLLPFSEVSVLLGTVYNFLPFMILPIYTVLVKLDSSQLEAAGDLGANGVQTFFKVVLPLSMPGVISGITMVFIPAITTFAISRLLGGGMFMLYGDLIEEQFITLGKSAWGVGSALSFILLILVLISMFVLRRSEREAGEEGGRLW